ncbi:MAG TPA: alanine--tRNA ligase [Ktedonobacterales bacterium]|nr:alanine--tRNA ligase [Ktedonobacterales bacterium]
MPAKRTSSNHGGRASAGKPGGSQTGERPRIISGAEARQTFVRFFEGRGHQAVPSSSLIPRNDPTVLLTTAGMQQMIPYFLGQEQPPSKLLTSVQKCFRTTDIDEVGDASHLTFFEMLGNFSVGDYFKRDAIAYAWELLTVSYGLPAARLFPTVHPDDDEAPRLWQEVAGFPAEGITRLSDNWWGPPGASGPCGPDSEIYYDRGSELGCGEPDCGPGCDRCERYLEIWNLVFMQYYQDTEGRRTPLQKKNIDTGMGLERLSMVLQGKQSVFDTDLFRPIIDRFAALAGTRYGENPLHDRSLRVIADHGRALVFLAADGVLPDASGRGYIFRRVLRRAVRHGKLLGLDEPFLAEAADTVIELMKGHYHELAERREQILDVLSTEELRFRQTLAAGMSLLNRELDELERAGKREVPGAVAFRLYDTHGFPLELTEEVAAERGMTVDRAGYDGEMQRQQEQTRHLDAFTRKREEEAWTQLVKTLPETEFSGYAETAGSSEILAIVVNGQPVDRVEAGQEAELVLAETPFYAEAGGQVGDSGVIGAAAGTFRVTDTKRPVPGLIAHIGIQTSGVLRVGDQVRAEADVARRVAIMRNHSATHLLHRALKDVLGEQVHQQGSLVAPDRLRFDFNLSRQVTPEEAREIDRRVNEWVLGNLPVTTAIMDVAEAKASGAMALFGEKYGDLVRVVTMGPSKELCGGTHVAATGQIGIYLTTQDTSVGSGVRRIEALTGFGAQDFLRERSELVQSAARRLATAPDSLVERVEALQEELGEAQRSLRKAQSAQGREEAERLAASAHEVHGVRVVSEAVSVPSDRVLRELADAVRARLGSGVIALAAEIAGQIRFFVSLDPATVERGLDAGKIARGLGDRLGGSGGGRRDSAQGGGKNPALVAPAMREVPQIVGALLG